MSPPPMEYKKKKEKKRMRFTWNLQVLALKIWTVGIKECSDRVASLLQTPDQASEN